MASTWANGVPRVTVSMGDTPKQVTFVYPYYENAEFFAGQLEHWAVYPADLVRSLKVIVVDDGSPVAAMLPSVLPVSVRLFRISVDKRWNWIAARNIGAHHAEDGWLLLTDMDHMVPEATLRALVFGQHDPSIVYAFSRREHTGESVGPHSASFFMTRAMFWQIGGYDERLFGLYGSDGLYRRRAAATAPIQILTDELVRYEFVADSSTTRYKRKQPEDAQLKARVASFPKGSKPLTLSFPYHEVVA